MKRKRNYAVAAGAFVLAAMLLTACGNKEKTKVVLTTGFDKGEIFRIDTISCYEPEMMVYLTNTQNRYEKVFGAKIWDTQLNGVTLEENIKETVLAKVAQIKTMALLADKQGVSLSKEEKQLAEQAGEEYFASLSEAEAVAMKADKELIVAMYEEHALAKKVYDYIIKDINPEISDDEARTITVQHILIKTYSLDGSGQRVQYTVKAKNEAYARKRRKRLQRQSLMRTSILSYQNIMKTAEANIPSAREKCRKPMRRQPSTSAKTKSAEL